jgi:peptidoglycan-associated lipoprotein
MNLRRLVWLCATVLFVALIVIGCSKKIPPPPPPPPAPPPAPTAPPPPPPPPPPPAPAQPPAPAPRAPTEDEIFSKKTLDQLNAEMPLADVMFEYDQFTIRDDQRGVLQKNADYLRRWTSVRATIEGHADARGTNEYNLALGQRRAESVTKMLVLMGARPDQIEAVSFGEEKPRINGHDDKAWSENRRSDFAQR